MTRSIDLTIDVTDAAALGTPASTVVTVWLPDGPLTAPPVVCFAFPGGGYSRRYYSFDMPDASGGGEAGFHTDRGWIFVTVDHLGFGGSTIPEGNALNYDNIAAGDAATVAAVMERLESGSLSDQVGPLRGAVKLGIGQSMGGCFTIVVQGQYRTFDGVGILGFSGTHTVVPSRPGTPPATLPWLLRGSDPDDPKILNLPALAVAGSTLDGPESLSDAEHSVEHPLAWAFHFDDVPAEIVAADMAASVTPEGPLPPWRSATIPPCGMFMLAPGTVATEVASIDVPVLLAMGERDVVPDPWIEPKAFKSATDITLYVCPRMGHMHNFASTREKFWERIHTWGTGVARMRAAAGTA